MGLTLDKLFLFTLPYFLNGESYNEFNHSYYLAGLISLFALLGFNFSIKTIRLKNSLILIFVFINSLVSCLVIWLFFEKGNFPILPLLFAFFDAMITIYQFELLFNGEIKKYFTVVIILFVVAVVAVATDIIVGVNLFNTLTILLGAALFFILPLTSEGSHKSKNDIFSFYISGLSAFVINTSAVAVLLFGKYTASVNFSVEISNSYIFASILISPMFYAGNIVERIIYTLNGEFIKKISWMILILFGLFIGYAAVLFILISFLPGLLPKAIDAHALRVILFSMLVGTSVFSAVHFPLNGVLFKELGIKLQKKLAVYQLFIMIFFTSVVFYFVYLKSENYIILLVALYVFLFLLVGVKFILIKKSMGGISQGEALPRATES